MPEYKAPGVYVEEVDTGAMPIEGVGTSTVGFIGPTERGPVDPKTAGLITSWEEFKRKFGSATDWSFDSEEWSSNVPYAVSGFFANGGSACYVARVTGGDADTASVALDNDSGNEAATVDAIGPGSWGNNVVVIVKNASSDPGGGGKRFRITIRYWITPPAKGQLGENKPATRPDVEEVYDELSADSGDDRFYESVINGTSDLVTITQETEGKLETESGGNPVVEQLEDGEDKEHKLNDYNGSTTVSDGETTRTGLEAFKAIDEIALVTAPDEHETDSLTDSLVSHCENQGDRFAILQAKRDGETTELPEGAASTRGYSAVYYPWVEVVDPQTGMPTLVPPGGHVAGVVARTDGERGVHKAPANEAIRGVRGLQRDVTETEQEELNPQGINCLRTFRGRGPLVYGTRTTAANPLWKYVNVRRLFLYLEESIQEGTQWAVFEPNNERLWARVRQSVSNFLTDVWNDGALMGETPEEAFYVKADRSTMTQNDIDNGKLVVEVGVAPTKPAEFVVFEITQWTSGAEGA